SPYTEPASRIAAVPDIEGSNVCLSCHSGLSSGQGIKDADYATEISGKNFGSFNSHYLAAGGIMFRTIGYEFANSVGGAPLNYDDASYYGHKNIGTANCESHGHPCSEDVRSGGPCVGCHMKDADSGHTLHVVEKDTGGIITGILANDGVCSNCHAGPYTLTATELEEQAEGFHEGLVVLEDALIANGIYYQTCYPYFYNTSPANCGPYYPSYPTPNPDVFTAWPDKQSLGAAFNFSMLHHEPGAYAHNRFYTQRLVFDSIDWLDGDTRLDDLGNFGTDGERMDGYIDLTGHTHAYDWLRGYGYPAITNVPRP
ncbi:MAG: hypothetical protein GWN77_02865, partial [Gammaproteobacteria bacterium]|nr:hypothetical protein [Gammaproteobacteria bacterium]